ncbi:ATP-binding protein [Granulosicoccus sp. 3-233]|uniref:ATP-binding protein n=1 Tax=Granulosicoccus sp. 3-233 TaxID=3417969 RepID=UPI003D334EFD
MPSLLPAISDPERVDMLQRALDRERQAREQAEHFLESRSRELYLANEDLKLKNSQIERRNEEIEKSNVALMNAQAQLMQSEKMACVGQLAAGVAHEINNPIGYITSNLGTLQTYTDVMKELITAYRQYSDGVKGGREDESLYQKIQEIQQRNDIDFMLGDVVELVADSLSGSLRVKEIVQGLKSFSRVDSAETAESDLHSGIESTLKVLSNELKYSCEVRLEFGDLPLVMCNLAKINQVFMNLLVNASQSFDEPGVIAISTRCDETWVYLSVSDTGCGIPEDSLGSIFDPFFTTKPVGSGTGLGLSISFGIIEEHGGIMSVESEVGVGSQFTIQLPIHQAGRT